MLETFLQIVHLSKLMRICFWVFCSGLFHTSHLSNTVSPLLQVICPCIFPLAACTHTHAQIMVRARFCCILWWNYGIKFNSLFFLKTAEGSWIWLHTQSFFQIKSHQAGRPLNADKGLDAGTAGGLVKDHCSGTCCSRAGNHVSIVSRRTTGNYSCVCAAAVDLHLSKNKQHEIKCMKNLQKAELFSPSLQLQNVGILSKWESNCNWIICKLFWPYISFIYFKPTLITDQTAAFTN